MQIFMPILASINFEPIYIAAGGSRVYMRMQRSHEFVVRVHPRWLEQSSPDSHKVSALSPLDAVLIH